jgi:PleD family two-component response regulator
MLTMREASVDYERGYMAGVDDYLTKKVPDAELFGRIHAAFNTLALRRSLQETRAALRDSSALDPESGAFTSRELAARLPAEIRRAQRYGRHLSLLTVGVQSSNELALSGEILRAVGVAIQGVIRSQIDWVGRIESDSGAAFGVVLPEAGAAEAPIVKERLRQALSQLTSDTFADSKLSFSFGLAAVDRDAKDGSPIEYADMLAVAEHCRACKGCSGQAQRATVQRSISGHLTIACRHGYVVDDGCTFKLELSDDVKRAARLQDA